MTEQDGLEVELSGSGEDSGGDRGDDETVFCWGCWLDIEGLLDGSRLDGPNAVCDVACGASVVANSPGVGPSDLDDHESEAASVACAAPLGVETRPSPGELKDERGDAPCGVVPPSSPVCPLEAKLSESKETVTVEVSDTMTLTLTEPSLVMRRLSVLLGVLLVNVTSEEPCISSLGLTSATRLLNPSGSERGAKELDTCPLP